MPRKLDSVLARFEETIEQNNAAGVCSGMYLTNQVRSRSPPSKPPKTKAGRRHSCHSGANSVDSVTNRRSSETSLQLQPGVYRNMLKASTDATVDTASTVESDSWDPFHTDNKFNESFSSIGDDCSLASFNDDDDDASAVSATKTTRKERPKDKKSAGRRSTRITKTKKSSKREGSKAERPEKTASTATEEKETEESDDEGGFALTYISARDKFTALTKQNSDRQLCKQSSRRKLLSGLKMTSKENLLSGSSNHSSDRRATLSRDGSNRSLGRVPGSSTTRRASSVKLLDGFDSSKCSSPPQKIQKSNSPRSVDSIPRDSGHSSRSRPSLDSSSAHKPSRVKSKSHQSDTKSNHEEVGRTRTSSRRHRTFQHTKHDN